MSFDACGAEIGPFPERTCDRVEGHEGLCMYGSGEAELEDVLQDWRDRIEAEELELEQIPPRVRTLLELEEGG